VPPAATAIVDDEGMVRHALIATSILSGASHCVGGRPMWTDPPAVSK
jgi:hypothetical protein